MNKHPHIRFLWAFGLGLMTYIALLPAPLGQAMRALLGANCFFVIYLLLMLRFGQKTSAEQLRKRAGDVDEGVVLILVLAVAAVAVSLGAIVLVLNDNGATLIGRSVALTAVPLGWASIQVMAGFHYAHLYWRSGGKGLGFPGQTSPGIADFLYFAFGIGMTAQVSDVTVTETAMRKVVLTHSVGSFFYNAVIIALAVNAAMSIHG